MVGHRPPSGRAPTAQMLTPVPLARQLPLLQERRLLHLLLSMQLQEDRWVLGLTAAPVWSLHLHLHLRLRLRRPVVQPLSL